MPALKARRSDRIGTRAGAPPDKRAKPGAGGARRSRPSGRPPGRFSRRRERRPFRRLAAAGLAAAAVLGVAVGAWLLDVPARALAAFEAGAAAVGQAAAAGLAVEEVFIEGRRRAPADDLRASLGVSRGDAILAVDPAAAAARLEANPWVAEARVERRLPDVLYIRIVERRPMALWQHRGELGVVDASGHVLTRRVEDYAALPLIVGAGAPAALPALVAAMAAAPDLRRRVSAASRVGNRRWTLRFDDRVDVLLPSGPPERGLVRLAALQRRSAILDASIARIDLRLPDRVLVRLVDGPPDAESNA